MKTIKLFLLAIAVVCFCVNANAVELGDYMEIDGVPSIVIYVDASGEHGMVMSAIAPLYIERETNAAAATTVMNKINAQKIFSSKGWQEYKNKAREEYGIERADFEAAYMELPTFDYYKYYKHGTKNHKELIDKHLVNLAWQTTEYGKENAKVIRNYCEENDVDMETFFPDQYWAESLGDGWFIPGIAEIELYTDFLGQQTGIAHKKKTPLNSFKDTTLWLFDETIKKLTLGYVGRSGFINHFFFAPIIVKTSTLMKSEWTLHHNGDIKVKDLYKEKKYNAFYKLTRYQNMSISYLIYTNETFGQEKYISSWIVALKEF